MLHAELLDPPEQPGQVFRDWSRVPGSVTVEAAPAAYHVPLLLPAIPAGTTLSVRLGIVLAGSLDRFVHVAVGTPYFQPGVDPDAVARRVDAALALVEGRGAALPASVLPALRADLAGT